MGIDQSTLNNDEEWDHKITFPNHPINPIIDPINFQNMLDGKCENIIKCGIPVSSSNDLHPYLTYKGYCWIFLATPGCITDNNWGIAGLFPLKKFKKLLAIDPIYQIPDHGNYHLSQLCKKTIYDTHTLYRIMLDKPGVGVSVIDLTPFQYKYTQEEKTKELNEISHLLNEISDNVGVLVRAREMTRDQNNSTSPFFCHDDAKAFDRGIEFMQKFKEFKESNNSEQI